MYRQVAPNAPKQSIGMAPITKREREKARGGEREREKERKKERER